MYHINSIRCAALATLACLSLPSYAVLLAPGNTVLTPGTTLAADPTLAGTVIEDVIRSYTFTLTDGTTHTQTLQDRIVRRDDTGTLDFYTRVFNDSVVVNIESVAHSGFAGFTTDVDYRIDGLGWTVTDNASRSSGVGDIVTFNYDYHVNIDNESVFFFTRTDATQYDALGSYTLGGTSWGINGSTYLYSESLAAFRPIFGNPVDEPFEILMLVSGIGAMSWLRRKR